MRVEDVPALVERGLTCYESSWLPTYILTEMKSEYAEMVFSQKIEAADILIEAAKQLKKPEAAKSAVDQLGDRAPSHAANQSAFWAAKENSPNSQGTAWTQSSFIAQQSRLGPKVSNQASATNCSRAKCGSGRN